MKHTEAITAFTAALATTLAQRTNTTIRDREMVAWLNGGGRKVDRIVRGFLGAERYRAAAKSNSIIHELQRSLVS